MTKLNKLIIVACCILGLAVNVNAQKGAVLEVSEAVIRCISGRFIRKYRSPYCGSF